jgi:hypothetical protein
MTTLTLHAAHRITNVRRDPLDAMAEGMNKLQSPTAFFALWLVWAPLHALKSMVEMHRDDRHDGLPRARA